jgi:protein SCO1
VKKVGEAPLEKPAAPAASSGFELMKPGEPVPDTEFIDQNGKPRTFSSFKGAPVAVTFIYTSCPLPDFCPLMDRHFATVQKSLQADPALRNVHLLSVTFDPVTDTPAVLQKHARALGADGDRWTFVTGDRDRIDQFAARFGVSIQRSLTDPVDITHNLRTAIVDADGRLAKVYTGNQWTPEQLITDLKSVAGAN